MAPRRFGKSLAATATLAIPIVIFFCILNLWHGIYVLESPSSSRFATSKKQGGKNNNKKSYSNSEIGKGYYDVCIVGAGLSGAVIAERYASELGKTSIVIEKRDHVGGNCYDYVDEETGILVNKYGAHLFHTNLQRVWNYVNQFSEWIPYEHRVLGHFDVKNPQNNNFNNTNSTDPVPEISVVHAPIPVNIDTVNMLFNTNIQSTQEMDDWLHNEQIQYSHAPSDSEEMALSRVGQRLYELIFKPYTVKQWGKSPKELGPEVTGRIPVRNDWDDRYFPNDFIQVLPLNGYTAMFDNMFANPLIEVHTNMDYFKVKDKLNCGHTYFSGPIDAYFVDAGYEKLEYRSIEFERKVVKDMEEEFFQPAPVVNYPSQDYDFTRIVEYKHFPTEPLDDSSSSSSNQQSHDTILFYERSKDDGDPYYPVPNERNKELYAKYQEMAEQLKGTTTFVGRLANYKYFNMDESIQNALELFDSHAPKVVVEQYLQYKTGGPEALLQLVLAFHAWMPNRAFYYQQDPEGEELRGMWLGEYPMFAELSQINPYTDLNAGDIFIIPEATSCPTHLVRKGVKVFVYQLGKVDATKQLKAGCQYISHNFYLSKESGVDVQQSHIIIPYMNVGKTHFGPIDNSKRENIIILNHDDNEGAGWDLVNPSLENFCRDSSSCEIVRPEGLKAPELNALFRRSKIIVTTCMRGTERMPVEAAMAGVVFLTNDCANSKDNRDFPLPREHIFSERNKLVNVVQNILNNFEIEQAKLDTFRSVYKNVGHLSMIRETKQFYRAATSE